MTIRAAPEMIVIVSLDLSNDGWLSYIKSKWFIERKFGASKMYYAMKLWCP